MRVISRIDIKNNHVIKGINLEGLRKIGEPLEIATKYYTYGVDEIILYNIKSKVIIIALQAHFVQKMGRYLGLQNILCKGRLCEPCSMRDLEFVQTKNFFENRYAS